MSVMSTSEEALKILNHENFKNRVINNQIVKLARKAISSEMLYRAVNADGQTLPENACTSIFDAVHKSEFTSVSPVNEKGHSKNTKVIQPIALKVRASSFEFKTPIKRKEGSGGYDRMRYVSSDSTDDPSIFSPYPVSKRSRGMKKLFCCEIVPRGERLSFDDKSNIVQ